MINIAAVLVDEMEFRRNAKEIVTT